MKMPWGKHKGTELEDLPTSYLVFLICVTKYLNKEGYQDIYLAANLEYQFRLKHSIDDDET